VIAPTNSQLRTLRLMAAGAVLVRANQKQAHLVVHRTVVAIVRAKTLRSFDGAGWIQFDQAKARWTISPTGRAHTEVGTFVRAFAAGE
jgi:hypothetical protein